MEINILHQPGNRLPDCSCKELVDEKVPQGFIHLALTLIVIPVFFLIERMEAAILKHAAEDILRRNKWER
jgi:hypothetical protein